MTDVQRLEDAISTFSSEGLDLSQRAAAFDQALALYRGPLLPAVDADFVRTRREHLHQLLVSEGNAFLDMLERTGDDLIGPRRQRLFRIAEFAFDNHQQTFGFKQPSRQKGPS